MYIRQNSGNGKSVTIPLRNGDETAVCGVFMGKFINCYIKISLFLCILLRVYNGKKDDTCDAERRRTCQTGFAIPSCKYTANRIG